MEDLAKPTRYDQCYDSMDPTVHGDYVTYEDYCELLAAYEEKRDLLEKISDLAR